LAVKTAPVQSFMDNYTHHAHARRWAISSM